MKKHLAFTLIELAVVLVLAGLIAGYALKMGDSSGRRECYATTKAQLEKIREAIERYAMSNNRFPLPARRYVGVDDPTYGREVALADIAQLDTVTAGNGAVAVFGALPVSTLGITMENANDCWGNKLTYVVTQDLADKTKFLDNETKGAVKINVKHGRTVLAEAGYAVISHGEDQLGAVKANWDYPTASTLTGEPGRLARKWCPVADGSLKTPNCLASTTDLISTVFNDGKDAGDNYFDDVIVYRGKPWRIGGGGDKVYCWGTNSFGQLGNPKGTVPYTTRPIAVNTNKLFVELYADGKTACGITDDGKVFCWGSLWHTNFMTGVFETIGVDTPVLYWDAPAGERAKMIMGSSGGQCFWTDKNNIYCWGGNPGGQLGRGGSNALNAPPGPLGKVALPAGVIKDMRQLAGARCVLMEDGRAYCWGKDNYGQLGDNIGPSGFHFENVAQPREVQMPPGKTIKKFAEASYGSEHMCVIGSDTESYCWGHNQRGALGNGSKADSALPVRVITTVKFEKLWVSSPITCGLTIDGDAYCWGRGTFGELGNNNNTADQTVPVAVSGNHKFTSIASVSGRTCGITTTGKAYCWGTERILSFGALGNGQAGTDHLVPSAVSGGLIFTEDLHSGILSQYSSLLTAKGKAWTWGRRSYGYNGDGGGNSPDFIDIPVPVVGEDGTPANPLSFSVIRGNSAAACGIIGTPRAASSNGWSDWSACTGPCDAAAGTTEAGTQTRTCSTGSCTGPSSQSCTMITSTTTGASCLLPLTAECALNAPTGCSKGVSSVFTNNCGVPGSTWVTYSCDVLRGTNTPCSGIRANNAGCP